MFWYGPQFGGWGWAAGFSSLVFWALLAAGIFFLVRSLVRGGQRPFPPRPGFGPGPGGGSGPGHPAPPAPAEHILAERFARGEIDEDEFHQRMTVLRAEAPHHPGHSGPSY